MLHNVEDDNFENISVYMKKCGIFFLVNSGNNAQDTFHPECGREKSGHLKGAKSWILEGFFVHFPAINGIKLKK